MLRIAAAGATLPRKVTSAQRRPIFLIPPSLHKNSAEEKSPGDSRPKWFDTISKRIGAVVKSSGEMPDRPARKHPRLTTGDISLPSVLTSTYRQPVVDTSKLSAAELLKTAGQRSSVDVNQSAEEQERCGTPDSELFAFDSDDDTITDENSGDYAVPDEILRKMPPGPSSLAGRNTTATSSYDSNYVSGASSNTQSTKTSPDELEIYDRVADDHNHISADKNQTETEEPIYRRLKNKVNLGPTAIEQDFTVC